MPSSPERQRVEAPGLSPAEQFVLGSFADQAAALGRLLAGGGQLRLEGCAPLDLTSATTLDFLLLAIRVAAKLHLQRGDDLLRLIERTGAIVDAARGARGDGGKTDAGLHLLRGIAMAELLRSESVGRCPAGRVAGARGRGDGVARRRFPRAFRRRAADGVTQGVPLFCGRDSRRLASDQGAARAAALADAARLRSPAALGPKDDVEPGGERLAVRRLVQPEGDRCALARVERVVQTVATGRR